MTNLSFFGIDLTSSVTAAADTDGDRIPDTTENFLTSDDPDNETTASFAYSKKSGKYYLGIVAVDGANKAMGSVIVAENDSAGDYQAIKKSHFSVGKGTPIGMVVLDSPNGDILIVASLFFGKNILDITNDDSYTITAYLPGADGIPDGKRTVTILAAGSMLGTSPINLGFGGLALDEKGVLYANVANKNIIANITTLSGALLVFSDSDGDGIPDQAKLFATDDSNPTITTASSIVAISDQSKGTEILVYGVNDILRAPSQILIYQDANGDLSADGAAIDFFTSPPQFQGLVGSFGDGTSAIEISHLDFVDGQALFAYTSFDADGVTVLDAGVASVKDQGSGVGGRAMRIFPAPRMGNTFTGITFVSGVPASPDKIAPNISITSPVAGAKLQGGANLTVNFTSSDNLAVAAHQIDFAADGNNFNIMLAADIPGTTQSFEITVPNIDTMTGALRVIARDAAGNTGVAVADQLIVQADKESPRVTVTAPKAKEKLIGGQQFTITFTSSDNVGVVAHDIQFSPDGGATFTPVITGLPGNAQSFMVMVPNMKVKKGVIKVIARDGAGNEGSGLSGIFKIKPMK